MTTEPTHKATRNWFRDLDVYAGWFMFWGTLASLVQPVAANHRQVHAFWTAKAHQALFGAGFGIVCALIFTFLQNGFNRPRTKSISWIFAIGSWAIMSMLVFLTTGHFG
jgi:hypothetical protein